MINPFALKLEAVCRAGQETSEPAGGKHAIRERDYRQERT